MECAVVLIASIFGCSVSFGGGCGRAPSLPNSYDGQQWTVDLVLVALPTDLSAKGAESADDARAS